MMHPMYPKLQIPAARVMGIGRQPALPANKLKIGDQLVLDYGKVYNLRKRQIMPSQKMQLHMISPETGDRTHRTVSLTSHVAVSWVTFNQRWTAPLKTGGKIMAGKKISPGKQIDLHTPINTGVSFHGTVDLTKQARAPKRGKKQKLF